MQIHVGPFFLWCPMYKEIWKKIKGWPNYRVSNLGRVKSVDRIINKIRNGTVVHCHLKGKVIKPKPHGDGYCVVGLHRDGRSKNARVHRLVASAFIDNPLKLPFVLHNDDDTSNNCADNLSWGTHQDNMDDMVIRGRPHNGELKGSLHPLARLTERDIPVIRKRLRAGDIPTHIARDYGIGKNQIYKIRNGTAWSHV